MANQKEVGAGLDAKNKTEKKNKTTRVISLEVDNRNTCTQGPAAPPTLRYECGNKFSGLFVCLFYCSRGKNQTLL